MGSASAAKSASGPKSASAAKPRARSNDVPVADRRPTTKRRRLRYKQPPPPSTWSVRSPIIENGFSSHRVLSTLFGPDEELAIESAVSEVEHALASPTRSRTTLRRPALSGE